MSLLLDGPAAILRIERSNAKANGLADGVFASGRVLESVPDELLDDGLQNAVLTTLLVLSVRVKVLTSNGLLAEKREGVHGLDGRLKLDGLNIRRLRNRLGTTALTRFDQNPGLLALGRLLMEALSQETVNQGVLSSVGALGGEGFNRGESFHGGILKGGLLEGGLLESRLQHFNLRHGERGWRVS